MDERGGLQEDMERLRVAAHDVALTIWRTPEFWIYIAVAWLLVVGAAIIRLPGV